MMWRAATKLRRVPAAGRALGFVDVAAPAAPAAPVEFVASVAVSEADRSSRSSGREQGQASSSSSSHNLRGKLSAWVSPGSAVYANPICSQLDQMLLKCDEFEDILTLLVTHRGVFFVHNLVTAIQVLGSLAQDLKNPIAVNELLRDPRYDVLIRDLLRFVSKLDFLAMTNVACSLWHLDHKHYTLLTRMLRPLLLQPVPDVTTVLRCAQAYAWAGYTTQHQFYAHCAAVLADAAPTLPLEQLLESCVLFGGVTQYNANYFAAAESAFLDRGLIRSNALHPQELGAVATAFATHLSTQHDNLLAAVALTVEQTADSMEVAAIAQCLGAFRKVALRFDGAVIAGLAACILPLRRAWLLRRHAEGVRTADVATLLECAAYFGIHTELTQHALDYLDDLVDEVGERAAINIVFAMCATGASGTHSRLLKFLLRKVGAGTAWEAQRLRVFHIWVCQLLQFPWLDVRLPRRCINAGLRAWCLHRRGYGSPFPDEVRAISAELEEMGVTHRTFVPVSDSPYEVDIAIGGEKDALLVISEAARNTLEPAGSTLLQIRHLRARGWRPVVIPRRIWLELAAGPVESRQSYLQSLLTAFQL